MRRPDTVAALAEFGRTRLSASFFMRDFLFSDVAAIHGLANVPDDPALAIAAGTRLCEDLLEPLQRRFGRIAIRSAFRSAEVNALCNERQRSGARGYGCASNEKNFAAHIWDRRNAAGRMGATACIVVPAFHDAFGDEEGGWGASPGGSMTICLTRRSSSSRRCSRSTSSGARSPSGGSTAMPARRAA